jgi:antitoxin component of MazEF toxin-antitoxin module
MRTRLVKLGEDFAVRIPPSFLEQTGLGKSFHILVEHGEIVLRRYENPRYGWSKAMKEAIRKHRNKLTDDDIAWLNAPLGPLADAKPTAKAGRHNRRRSRTS